MILLHLRFSYPITLFNCLTTFPLPFSPLLPLPSSPLLPLPSLPFLPPISSFSLPLPSLPHPPIPSSNSSSFSSEFLGAYSPKIKLVCGCFTSRVIFPEAKHLVGDYRLSLELLYFYHIISNESFVNFFFTVPFRHKRSNWCSFVCLFVHFLVHLSIHSFL